MERMKAWVTLESLGRSAGWTVQTTYAQNDDWRSWALRGRSDTGQRVIGLWRGRHDGPMRFTSACTWGAGMYFTALSAAELRSVLRGT